HEVNTFQNTNLLDLLKSWETERVVVTGMMTHMCVDAASRAAVDFGFDVIVAEDACATRDLQHGGTTVPADLVHKSFLAALTWYGKVMKTDEVIALLASEMSQ
ncbi:MAG TPA: isochorismatase family protein, partial [Anaerolineales bacterium]|nr:isochorismatase family protein [Anaerolineales bacterium]